MQSDDLCSCTRGTTYIFVAILLIFIVMLLIHKYLLTTGFQPRPVLSTVTDGHRLNDGSTYNFSTSSWWVSHMYLMETILQILNLDLFLGYRCMEQYFLGMLGNSSESQLPISQAITRVNTDMLSTILYSHDNSIFHF